MHPSGLWYITEFGGSTPLSTAKVFVKHFFANAATDVTYLAKKHDVNNGVDGMI